MSLKANRRGMSRISIDEFREKISKRLKVKNVKLNFEFLENGKKKIKIIAYYFKNEASNIFFKKEITFFR